MTDKNTSTGIILNDDFAHFISSRYRNGIEVNRKVIEEYIDQYIGTQVTEFCININASLSYTPSEIIETVFDKFLKKEVNGIPVDFSDSDLALAYDIYVNKGLDMHKIMFEQLRQIGIEPWVSIRMNDLHGFKDVTDSRSSEFRSYAVMNNLCHVTHRPHHDYFDKCFDYKQPEIRNRMMAYIDEQLNNYDVDGIELDFMREAFCFKIGEEAEGRLIINDMLRHIRATAEVLSKERGHKIKIMIRVPASPIDAYDMGFDIYTWASECLADILIVTPRFTTCDSTMPLESWVRMFEKHSMEIVGGIELFTHPRINEMDYSFCNTPEMAAGFAMQYLGAGTNKVYLYNYFDDPGLKGNPEIDTMSFTDKSIECDNDRGACAQAQCYNKEFLSTIGSIESCIKLPRRHILTYRDFGTQWVEKTSKLPFKVVKPNYEKVTVKTEYVCMKTGEIPQGAKAYLVVGFGYAKSGDDLIVWCNSKRCKYLRTTEIYPHMSSNTVYVYELPHSSLKDYSQIFEFASETQTLELDYLEIRVFTARKITN